MPPVEAILIGAGQRGRDAMGAFALRHPDELTFVAVAEPDPGKRERFAHDHNIPRERCFASHDDILAKPLLAPLCFNGTMDRDHIRTAIPILEKGYELFLEKPMADTPEGCLRIEEAARRTGRLAQICHPLRYTGFYITLKKLIEERAIGDVLSFTMVENVAYWHYGHSYVRGNWSRQASSGPMILTKCCHDMDVATWLADSRVRWVSSFGKLTYFRPENAPSGAPERCTDGCPAEKTCPFFAPAQYLTDYVDWPVGVISLDRGLEARRRAIETGPYGRCVYRAGNDVVDHQVVAAEFENDITLDFTVHANSFGSGRTIRVIGTEGEINGHVEKLEISVVRFKQGFWPKSEPVIHNPTALDGAHGGGDTGVIRNFLRCHKENDASSARRSLEIAVEGHLLAFAAEQARVETRAVAMASFRKSARS